MGGGASKSKLLEVETRAARAEREVTEERQRAEDATKTAEQKAAAEVAQKVAAAEAEAAKKVAASEEEAKRVAKEAAKRTADAEAEAAKRAAGAEAEAAKKVAAAKEEAAKRAAAAESEVAAAKDVAAKKVDNAYKPILRAYKVLSRFNLLGAVQEQEARDAASGTSLSHNQCIEVLSPKQVWRVANVCGVNEATGEVRIHYEGFDSTFDEWIHMSSSRIRSPTQQQPSSQDVSSLREAIKAGDADAAKVFLDLRGDDGNAPQITRERKPLSELDMEVEDVIEREVSELGVSISGVGSVHSDLVNGTYFPVPGEKSGGKLVYKEVQRDAWIEFHSDIQKWQVKAQENKGKNRCWMTARETCGNTNAVDEVTCGWNTYNGTTKEWEEQTDVVVEKGYSPVKITGVGSVQNETVDGTYFPVPGEKRRGKPVYKEVQRDAWIEFFSGTQKWQVKAKEHKGKNLCWMTTRETCGSTDSLDEVTCGWEAYNGAVQEQEAGDAASGTSLSHNLTVGVTVKVLSLTQAWRVANVCGVNEATGEVQIHYVGFDSQFDEWIHMSSSRIRSPEAGDAASGTSLSHNLTVGVTVECIEVLSPTGAWRVANVCGVNESTGEVQIHYEGFDSKFDEWIHMSSSRIRSPTQQQSKEWEDQTEVKIEAGIGVRPGTVLLNYTGSALHCAAALGVAGTCRVLLDACKDWLTCVDAHGLTARQLAEEKGHTEVVQAIDDWIELKRIKDARQMQTEEAETALRTAAQDNDVSTLQDLLRQGVDPFAQDEAGDTALHLAASKGHVPAVFHILNSKAAKDVTRWSLRNKRGRTAGELAVDLGFSEVTEEIDRHTLNHIILVEEQHTTLASRVQLKIRACQEECSRLQAALAEVEARCEEYKQMYTEGAQDCILSVDNFRSLVQTVLTRDKRAGTHSADTEERFNSQAETLVCGEFADAAKGLIELLQVEEGELFDKVRGGLEKLELEIKMFGDEETIELFDYVVNQQTSEREYPNGIRDQDREEECLADFARHANALEAKLNECELAALRMYTLPTFKHINNPLRDQARVRAGQFHPLALLTEHLTRALKKLRRIDATRDAATQALTLWRGMKDLTVSEQYSSTGGTELAPMSTTCDFKTAVDFCMSANSLIFCIQTKNKLQRGVDLAWISAFPGESEVLFPPLTYLQPTGRRQVVEVDGMRFTIVEVNPTIA